MKGFLRLIDSELTGTGTLTLRANELLGLIFQMRDVKFHGENLKQTKTVFVS